MPHAPQSFDDLNVGTAFTAGPREITRTDIDDFTRISGDRTALHSDDAYASTTPFGGVVAHGALSLAVATGLAYQTGIFEGTVLAVRQMDVRFDRPVFPGDSLDLVLTVVERDEKPRPDRGRVRFEVNLRNQDGRTVLSGRWTLVMRRLSS
ncbi:MAG: MaoC/PaaZ C-terminal domain-containing protein [Planctomycetota bacterium]|jgi:acyl dehydratase